MKNRILLSIGMGAIVAASGFVVVTQPAYAQLSTNSKLTQSIQAGTLSTSILDGTGATVTSPSFGFGNVTVATSGTYQTSTGTFGSDAQRIYVDNPGVVTTGTWTLALAPTSSSLGWTKDGTTQAYDFDAATAAAGQLSITSAGTVTPVVGTSTGITGASTGTFSSMNASFTIMTGAASSDDVWKGYITGIGLSQTIPAAVPAGSYYINMTQTLTSA